MPDSVTIKILTGSVRPGRFNIQPATWIYELARKRSDMQAELLDLQNINLPFLDEPAPPSRYRYTKRHTRDWANTIDHADGFIFVTPEYNHGIPPVLKNAVDYLYYEWHYKPVCFVSYGSLAGGSRAVEHWRTIAAELKMYDMREQVMLPSFREQLDENGLYKFTDRHEASAGKMLDSLAFWAREMKQARGKLHEPRP